MPITEDDSVQLSKVTPLRRATDKSASTEAAQGVSQLERTLLNIPSADRAKVAAIKAALLEGRYKIDAEAVAASMAKIEAQLDK